MIDASIPLGVRPVQIESPLNSLAQIAQLQGAQQQNALLQMKMDEVTRTREDEIALRNSLSAPGADPYKVLVGRGKITEAAAYAKSQNEAAKQKVELVDAKLKQSRQFLDTVQTPEQYIQWHQANHADPVLGPELAARGVTAEKSLASIQQAIQTPGGFQDLLRKSALGLEKFTELNKPTTTVVNAGGTSQVMQTPGLGGTPQTVSTVQHTQSPDNAASNARAAADAAAGRAVTMRGQNLTDARSRESNAANMSKPFEVTGPEGQAVLVQQDRQGNITPVAGYAPKGGGKPLTQGAYNQLTEARNGAVTIDRLAGEFKPEYASKGVLGFGSEASMTAKGVLGTDKDAVEWWKNYRRQAELVERHALFGASLTTGEKQSWASADINPSMDADVIKRHLKTRRELSAKVLDTTRQDLIDAGHSQQRVNSIAGRGPTPADTTPDLPAASAIDAELARRAGKKP